MTLNGKKILAESYFGEKKFTNSNDTQKKLPPPPHPCSVPKSIQKQIVEYNIKSK